MQQAETMKNMKLDLHRKYNYSLRFILDAYHNNKHPSHYYETSQIVR